MKLTYDPRYNIAYLRLHAKTVEVETVRVNDAIYADVAPDGTVYGIELLNANEQLWAEAEGGLVVVNEALASAGHSRSDKGHEGLPRDLRKIRGKPGGVCTGYPWLYCYRQDPG